jgi:hypothetical protein
VADTEKPEEDSDFILSTLRPPSYEADIEGEQKVVEGEEAEIEGEQKIVEGEEAEIEGEQKIVEGEDAEIDGEIVANTEIPTIEGEQ